MLPFLLLFLLLPSLVTSKSTIEPCSNSDSCNALVGYSLYTDLKVSQVASLFQVDPLAVLAANGFDIAAAGVDRILPAGLLLRIPVVCSCADGIRKSVSVRYTTHPGDTLASIAGSIYGGLVSADQIREANSIDDPDAIDSGWNLAIPLPCTCFNSTDNQLPAIYLSYVVKSRDTLGQIAAAYSTTVADIMNVNGMSNPSVSSGDILAVPLPACASSFPRYATDYGLIAANGSFVLTAGHCVQCSCGPSDFNLYCEPTALSLSCASMQCANSNLMLGGTMARPSSGSCAVTSCSYSGFLNGTISTQLITTIQPKCPGPRQLPGLSMPPTTLVRRPPMSAAPAPAPEKKAGRSPAAEGPSGRMAGSVAGKAAGDVGGWWGMLLSFSLLHSLSLVEVRV